MTVKAPYVPVNVSEEVADALLARSRAGFAQCLDEIKAVKLGRRVLIPRSEREARRVRSAHAGFARWGTGERAEMMVELANLREKSCKQFRKQHGIKYHLPDDDQQLLKRRDELRNVWSGNQMGDSEVTRLLRAWLHEAARSKTPSWILVPFARMRYGVIPNYPVLPLSLAIGATELGLKMAICANPTCRNPYFLKGRKTQRFCNLRACAVYGQREHKRNWWNSHRATARGSPPYSAPAKAAQDSGRLKRTPEEEIKSPANDAKTSRTG